MAGPLGYHTRKIPEGVNDLYEEQVVDKCVSIVKSAIQNYIDSFLNPSGRYRSYLKHTSSPEGLQYVTEVTFDEEMKTSPNQRKTYLARWFAENTGRVPSILIIDQGVEHMDVGLNDLIEGRFYQGKWLGQLQYWLKVSLSIQVCTYSEEDTNTLSSVILFIFSSLANVINNGILREPGKKWEIRMPLAGISAGQMSNITIEGDTKKQAWLRSVDIPFDIENLITVQLPTAEIATPANPVYGQQAGTPPPRVLNLDQNQKLKLGQRHQLFIENMRQSYYLGTSDPNIAVVSREPPWVIQPIRQGKVLLYIFDNLGDAGQDPVTGRKRNLLVDVPFQVTI